MCESHWDTDRYFKIWGRFVNNQKIIGRTYSPPKRQHGPRVSSFCLTIEKSWHKMKPTDGFYAMTTNCCTIKCMDDTHVHMRLKRKFIFETLFLRVDFASGACLVTTEFNVPIINLAQTAMLQTTFAVLLQLLVLLQQYNSGCCLIRLFSSFYRVWALAAQLQIAWNSNFNHLRLHTLFIVIGCAIKKNWSPTTNCKTWCLYYYKITFHCVNNHVHIHTHTQCCSLSS